MPLATGDRYELALNGEGQPTFNSLPAILSLLDSEETEQRAEGASYLVQERRDLKVSRRLMLGDTLDVDHVDAEYLDGVLTLRIPLQESAKPRQVEVRRGEARALLARHRRAARRAARAGEIAICP